MHCCAAVSLSDKGAWGVSVFLGLRSMTQRPCYVWRCRGLALCALVWSHCISRCVGNRCCVLGLCTVFHQSVPAGLLWDTRCVLAVALPGGLATCMVRSPRYLTPCCMHQLLQWVLVSYGRRMPPRGIPGSGRHLLHACILQDTPIGLAVQSSGCSCSRAALCSCILLPDLKAVIVSCARAASQACCGCCWLVACLDGSCGLAQTRTSTNTC